MRMLNALTAAVTTFREQLTTPERYVVTTGDSMYDTCTTEQELVEIVQSIGPGTQFDVEHCVNINDKMPALVKKHGTPDKEVKEVLKTIAGA